MGANSGAHISVITKSGTNQIHGTVYEKWQNSDMNAAPFFYNASPAVLDKDPFLNRNQFGGVIGGPIKKDKLFYFLSYQGIRVVDLAESQKDVTVPTGLTSDRSAQGIVNAVSGSGYAAITASQISAPALSICCRRTTLPNGQYLIPSAAITNKVTAKSLGYDALETGPNSSANVDQGIAAIDYAISDRDRLTGKYYVQNDPTDSPFGAVGSLLGFAQTLEAGSQVASVSNTVVLSPNLTWSQRIGVNRLKAYAHTGQDFTPSQFGINLLGSTGFPQILISSDDPTLANALEFGPSTSFGNAGMYQNQGEAGTTLTWVKGRHTFTFGGQYDGTQLNVVNRNTDTDELDFKTFLTFVEGTVVTGSKSVAFDGSASATIARKTRACLRTTISKSAAT